LYAIVRFTSGSHPFPPHLSIRGEKVAQLAVSAKCMIGAVGLACCALPDVLAETQLNLPLDPVCSLIIFDYGPIPTVAGRLTCNERPF
jgi:hypothetical protein